jgi:hypothetical protein
MVPEPKWSHPPTTSLMDIETWPANLMDIIRAIKTMPPCHPTQPEFTFDLTPEAAAKNYLVLMKKYNGNLGASLEAQRNLIVGYGLDIRNVDTLQKSLVSTQTGRGCPQSWRMDRNGPSNPSMKS